METSPDFPVIDSMHAVVDLHVRDHTYATILDVGAWFIPYPRATHVIDLMPWETRGGKLRLRRAPGESFSRETWIQLDLCAPSLRFPFGDQSLDFAMCSGTLEDLPDPTPCIREIRRVARAGYLRVPSMASELTIGINGRATGEIGYSHHHWICRRTATDEMLMMAKADAHLSPRFGRCLPLRSFERLLRNSPEGFDRDIHFFWQGAFSIRFLTGPRVRDEVGTYLRALGISRLDYWADACLRCARRMRERGRGKKEPSVEANSWWNEVLELSKPYLASDWHRRAGDPTSGTEVEARSRGSNPPAAPGHDSTTRAPAPATAAAVISPPQRAIPRPPSR